MRPPASRLLAAALAIAWTLAACGSSPEGSEAPTPVITASQSPGASATLSPTLSTTTSATTSPPPIQSPSASAEGLDTELIVPGRLSICSAFPRLRFAEFDAAGNPFGVDIDIALALAERLGLEPDVHEVLFEDLIGAVVDGRCDVAISGHFITRERLTMIDLVPYREGRISPVVATGNPLEIDELIDLCGRSVAVVAGTIYVDAIRAAGEYVDSGVDRLCAAGSAAAVDLAQFESEAEAVAALDAGDVDAFVGNEAIAVERPNEFELSNAELPRLVNGIGHRLSSPGLDDAIRSALRDMIDDRSYASILERYGASGAALSDTP